MIPFFINRSGTFSLVNPFLMFFFAPFSLIIYLQGMVFSLFPFYKINNYLCEFIFFLVTLLDKNKLYIVCGEINIFFYIIYYFLLCLSVYFLEIKRNKMTRNVLFAQCIFISVWSLPIKNYITYEIDFINVGQGDATLISYKNNNFLIDTGGLTYQDVAKNCLIPYFKKNNIYKIDALFITHNDYDHVGALESLKRNFRIGNIYSYNDTYPITVKGLKMENLNIYKNMRNDENLKSCVFKFKLQDKTFLIMGDAPKEIEKMIIKDNKELTVDYLKVGHHGSNTSTDESFISSINPKVAIISCGYKNKFNHPSKETIDILLKYKISIKRTDIDDTITIFI